MTVSVLKFEPDIDVVPQAIIWRSLRYCTLVIREGHDDLDKYKGASFAIGNDITFDLRVYQGHIHADVTVTLYLPEIVRDEKRVSEIVSRVINEMAIPVSAIAWRRGQDSSSASWRSRRKTACANARLAFLSLRSQRASPNVPLPSANCGRKFRNILTFPRLIKRGRRHGGTRRLGRSSSAIQCLPTQLARRRYSRKVGQGKFPAA